MKNCSVPGCDKPFLAKSYCSTHYANFRRHGVAQIPGVTPRGEPLRWLANALKYEGDDCLIWPFSRNGDGYGAVLVKGRVVGAHRWVCRQIHGDPLGGRYQASHSCGNGGTGCVNPHHISWKTPAGNAADRKAHGTELYGEARPIAKLTREKVAALIADWQTGRFLKKDLAEKYGVAAGTVWAILSGRTWLGVERGSTARSEAA